jgi:hypothetical protein
MLRITTARSGHPTLRWGNVCLHSPYDPVKEAKRFIQESIKEGDPSVIILLGPGLGYLTEAISQQLPQTRQICLYYSERIFNKIFDKTALKSKASWCVGSPIPLVEFLKANIHELDMEGLRVIEWPASAKLFPRESKLVNQSLSQFLRQMRGNLVTTGAMGRLWIRNTIENFVEIEGVTAIEPYLADRPVAIVASGPSLEKAVPLLDRVSRQINLWALPSAVPFLVENAINPDLVVMTDPGYYSISHLHPIKDRAVLLAMPLSAATGVQKITDKVHLFTQSNFFEEQLIGAAGISTRHIPAMGTVAASSLELALQCTEKEIIFFGLDLCYRDIQSHARPNLHDSLVRFGSNRLSPHHSRVYGQALETAPNRVNGIRVSLPLRTYHDWFASLDHYRLRRVFRFMPSPIRPGFFQEITQQSLKNLLNGCSEKPVFAPRSRYPSYPQFDERCDLALRLLEQWCLILLRHSNEVGQKKNWKILFQSSEFLSLSRFIDLADLLSLRRITRSAADSEKLQRAVQLIDKQLEFIALLKRRVKHLQSRRRGG